MIVFHQIFIRYFRLLIFDFNLFFLVSNEDTAQYFLTFQEMLESEGNGENGGGGGEEEEERERIEQYFKNFSASVLDRSLIMSDARLHYKLGKRVV